ncbi:MAG: hypothetical protein ABMA64_29975 [Myxococcota bacterium]
MVLELCGEILRDPVAVVDRGSDRARFAVLAPRLLAITVASAVVFGAVTGSYRGGIQVGFAALKMPLVFLVPLLAALPASRAMYRVSGVELDPTRLGLAGLVGVARAALLAAALAPVLWLLYSLDLPYHLAVVVFAGMLALAGLPGLATLGRVIPGTARAAALGSVFVLGLVTAQTGWVLRPFVARPTAEVSLVRPLEGDITGSLLRSPLAALGVYLSYEPEVSPWTE